MNRLNFFYRQTNPLFFSIEKVFNNIARTIREDYGAEFSVEEILLPLTTSPRNILKNIRFSRRHQSDINHITGDIHYALLGWDKRKINILTIHDCVSMHQYSKMDLRYWIMKWVWFSWPVRKADMVTVISENTKNELLSFTRIDPGKIRVIPNFVDPELRPFSKEFNSTRPRILFIGTTPNKNLERFARALNGIPAILDIVGKLDEEQVAVLRRENIRYEQSYRLPAEEIRKKYEQCDLLAFPSTYEGFGLPIVEAQVVGRPVLTSQLFPMKEVAGKGACLADPYDTDSIRAGLLRIISEPGYRETLVEEGKINVTRYSLAKVSGEYVSLYRELLHKKSIL
jgi:glycosyltransferase involved in cell wall biosynthesis